MTGTISPSASFGTTAYTTTFSGLSNPETCPYKIMEVNLGLWILHTNRSQVWIDMNLDGGSWVTVFTGSGTTKQNYGSSAALF